MTVNPHIALLLPDLRGGGAERVAINLANRWISHGHAVDVVLMSQKGIFLADLNPKVRIIDLQVKRARGVLFPLIRYLRHTRPNSLLACMWPLTVIAVWARALACVQTRLIVAEHTTWSRSKLLERPTVGWQVRTSMHYTFPKADGILAVSQGAADDLARFAKLDRQSISFIYNPVAGDEKSLGSIRLFQPESWWLGDHRKVLAVGTLKAIKDYATLLNAFEKLRHRLDARLLILGEGECRIDLEAQVCALGIVQSVFMPGFVKDPAPYYQHADLHVLSSTGEGFGNVIVEALAAGTPIVSTDCPSGPREILCDGKYGRLVPVGDADALAQAMQAALAESPDREALKARARDFAVDKIADEYLDVMLPGWRGAIHQ